MKAENAFPRTATGEGTSTPAVRRRTRHQDFALLVTRLLVAFIFLWHGVPKALDPPTAMEKFAGWGLPPLLGPITGWVEVACSILIVAGLLHRWSSLVLAVIITGAIVTVQIPAGMGADLERDLLILVALLTLAAHGPGSFALDMRRATGS